MIQCLRTKADRDKLYVDSHIVDRTRDAFQILKEGRSERQRHFVQIIFIESREVHFRIGV